MVSSGFERYAVSVPGPDRGATALVSVRGTALRSQIFEFLGRLGFDVLGAGTEQEILEIAGHSTRQLDLLMSDLPLRNWVKLTRRSEIGTPHLRVLLLSADPEHVNRSLLRDQRVEFIEKPFAWRELEAKLGALLPRKLPLGRADGCFRNGSSPKGLG